MLRVLTIVLVGLVLQGCSAIKFGYNQAPSLGYWWLDSQLSFGSGQSDQVRDALTQLQRWHREKELGTYTELLVKLQAMSTGDVDAQQVCDVWSQVNDGMDRLMLQAIRLATPVAQQLQPRQLRHLVRHWEDKNEAWEDEWLGGSAAERLKRRLDKAVSRYSDFYGTLSDAQTRLLQSQLQKSTWNAEWGRRERLRRQQTLLNGLQRLQQSETSPQQAQAILLGVWQQWLVPPTASDRQIYKNLVEQSCSHLAELHNSTSPAQRQRAARKLRAYEADLRELAAPP